MSRLLDPESDPTSGEFARRHLGFAPADATIADDAVAVAAGTKIRQALGLDPGEHIMDRALPPDLRAGRPELADPLTEAQTVERLAELAAMNNPGRSMIGLGYYRTFTPAVIRRLILENPSWYTAYTPYQPEISQGRLEALFVFQTMIAELTGLPVANASLLDEATAAAEAMTLCDRATRRSKPRFAVDVDVFPQVRAVLETRAEPLGIELAAFDPERPDPAALAGAAGLYIQYQGASGRLVDLAPLAELAHRAGALLAVGADPLMLTLVQAPGDAGADIVVGSTQRFGVPMGFGGPHAAYMSVRQDLVRQLPGRLVGLSRDAHGDPALRLSLVTREQHIRRDKATSNVCTAQVLLAVMAAMYAVWHGPEGLRRIARRVNARAEELRARLNGIGGVEVRPGRLFDTLAVRAPGRSAAVVAAAGRLGLKLWRHDPDTVYLSTDEATTAQDLDDAARAFGGACSPAAVGGQAGAAEDAAGAEAPGRESAAASAAAWLAGQRADFGKVARRGEFMTQTVFHRHRTELAMTRYLKSLADKDYAMDRGMIPLGSCTMKLNAVTELSGLTWPGFADLHPFQPLGDAAGSVQLMSELSQALLELTGYDALSLQPNAGSQGELAGLLAIRRYHQARGEGRRTVCLIPTSAHGTNAASAALAGYQVESVGVDPGGNVSLEDLRAKLAQHAGRVGALMLTYPSTHGVYEAAVREICAAAHDAGAQVYIDGANFNALVGWSKAGHFGGDVSHLNLHKTFAIPHGGGGPGVGPVACRRHLAPYLPGHPFGDLASKSGAVSAAPFGSALVLSISWAYIKLMGAHGLMAATDGAVLAANYVARRLDGVFPVLYRGPGGYVAHECLLDLREFSHRTGVSVDDVAKRLMDFGFHAPTMSFPVAGTLMVEPTESESLAELDRFCDAMRAITAEAGQVEDGEWPLEDSPLRNAPHTAAALLAAGWTAPYSRALGAYPAGSTAAKYWPPVGRVDATYGDRNLVLTLPTEAGS
ncbi:MAG: aminomethyl-transferring glycine dehydrogenase [Bifidobacteriaceae bacterium]|jgi:glycine dehydrogenase|nr:aminomethyl-transferring glycine dehydrogenase [Bifidobacteriaceae bacterium]